MTALAPTQAATPVSAEPVSAPASVSLGQLRCGERGVICGIAAMGDAAAQRRLRQLGFVEGREVELVRRAPLGSPVVVRVCDAQICLRSAQTELISVATAQPA